MSSPTLAFLVRFRSRLSLEEVTAVMEERAPEFRALAGIVHPNLVMLHDLIEWEGRWMFTMERVPGVTFRQAGWTKAAELKLGPCDL